ncbi:MAG: hypothetical protein AB4080_04565 [Trichodesmium sp.]
MIKFKTKLNRSQPPEAGYTIIESLVAMIMVATLMAAVAPVIALSVGMRVQARRMELAAQAARSYIDAVRLGETNGGLPAPEVTDDQEIPASALEECFPTNNDGTLQYCSTITPLGDFYCVDNDGDDKCTPNSVTDMMVYGGIDLSGIPNQNHRNQIENGDSDTRSKLGYPLQVRVYSAATFSTSVTLPNQFQLFETKTDISPTEKSFQNYRDRFEED